MIQLAVCDDHDMVRTALVRTLQSSGDFQVVAEASNADELLARLAATPGIELLLLDLSLGRAGVGAGIEAIGRVRAARPALPIVALSMHDDPEIVRQALQAGAQGYVTKDSSFDVLQDAIRQVHLGRRFLDPNLVESVVTRPPRGSGPAWDAQLTPREREVLQMISAGQRLRDIADQLHLSVKTVSTHKMRLMQKLNVTNNADLIRLCVEHDVR